MDAKKWISENCHSIETKWFNGIEYKFCTTHDGWIAIFEVMPGGLFPKIQAKDMQHAESYCSMIEPVSVPMTLIN